MCSAVRAFKRQMVTLSFFPMFVHCLSTYIGDRVKLLFSMSYYMKMHTVPIQDHTSNAKRLDRMYMIV